MHPQSTSHPFHGADHNMWARQDMHRQAGPGSSLEVALPLRRSSRGLVGMCREHAVLREGETHEGRVEMGEGRVGWGVLISPHCPPSLPRSALHPGGSTELARCSPQTLPYAHPGGPLCSSDTPGAAVPQRAAAHRNHPTRGSRGILPFHTPLSALTSPSRCRPTDRLPAFKGTSDSPRPHLHFHPALPFPGLA